MNVLDMEASCVVEMKHIVQDTPVHFAGLIGRPLTGAILEVVRDCHEELDAIN